jgi:hypothetical protein
MSTFPFATRTAPDRGKAPTGRLFAVTIAPAGVPSSVTSPMLVRTCASDCSSIGRFLATQGWSGASSAAPRCCSESSQYPTAISASPS